MKKFYIYLIFLAVVFLGVQIWMSLKMDQVSLDVGEANERLIMKNYVETHKSLQGGEFTIDTFWELNRKYENIFSYFELPSDKNGIIVPLKGPSRIFLKMPLFMFSAEYFWGIWKFISTVLFVGFFLMYYNEKSFGQKALLPLLLLLFIPYNGLDLEFSCLFILFASYALYRKRHNKFYLVIFYIFGLYSSIMRTEFFSFFAIIQTYHVCNNIYLKKYYHAFISLLVSVFFLSTLMVMNYKYYGSFFEFGYSIEKDVAVSFDQGGAVEKIIKLIFPMGFYPIEAFNNIKYTFLTVIGVGCLFIASFSVKKIYKSHFSNYGIIVFFTIVYGIILYGSNRWFYRPTNPIFSSYIRYFSFFYTLIWFYGFNYFTSIKRNSILLFCLLIILLSSTQHFFLELGNLDKINQYFTFIRDRIPPQSSVLFGPKSKISTFQPYKFLQPSGSDTDQYEHFRGGITSNSTFLDKIIFFISDSQETLYIMKYNNQSDKRIKEYLQRGGLSIIDENSIFITMKPLKKVDKNIAPASE